jgi:hypothetical protein
MLKRKTITQQKGQHSKVTVSSWIYENLEVAISKSYKDYVHAKPSDMIRTKRTTVSDVQWNKTNLKVLFPNLTDQIDHLKPIWKLEKKEGSLEFWITNSLKDILPATP